MFFKIMTSYIIGYVYVSIEGYYIERFINICKKNNIIIWNLRKEKNIILFFNVNIKEFKEICKIAQKVNCKVKIINKKGLPFLIHKYKKRKIFAALLLIVIFRFGCYITVPGVNSIALNGYHQYMYGMWI